MNMTPLSGSNKIVVVGGGAAGMMAAGMAAQAGAQVTLLEQNGRLGKKLLITGKGRRGDPGRAAHLYRRRPLVRGAGQLPQFLFPQYF